MFAPPSPSKKKKKKSIIWIIFADIYIYLFQFGDDHPKEVEELWAALCTCWPNNLKVIIRYLFIITGMAAAELLAYVSGNSEVLGIDIFFFFFFFLSLSWI